MQIWEGTDFFKFYIYSFTWAISDQRFNNHKKIHPYTSLHFLIKKRISNPNIINHLNNKKRKWKTNNKRKSPAWSTSATSKQNASAKPTSTKTTSSSSTPPLESTPTPSATSFRSSAKSMSLLWSATSSCSGMSLRRVKSFIPIPTGSIM